MDVFNNFTLLCCGQGSGSGECPSHCKIFAMLLVHDRHELFFRKLPIDLSDSRSHNVSTSHHVWNSTHVDNDPWQPIEGGSIGQYRCQLAFPPKRNGYPVDKYNFRIFDSLNLHSGLMSEMSLVGKPLKFFNQGL